MNPQAQQAIRIRVVAFLKSAKGTQKQAADVFKVSLPAVKKIWKKFKQGGLKALKVRKRGPHNSPSLISRSKVAEITRCIKRATPDSYHLPYHLWTAGAVRLLIKKSLGKV